LCLRGVIPVGGDGTAYGIPILIAAYTVAAHLDGRPLIAGGALTAAMAVYLMITEGQDLGGVVFYSLLFGAPFVGGRIMRLLRGQRDEKAKVAVADERQRIARELHDVVAHAISVVVLQSRGGRKVLDSDPAAAREAFDAIERTSSQALEEMRRLLGLLRAEDEPALLAQPTLERVGTLAGELRASGLPVEVVVEGEPVALPPGVDVSAYRIVQEALTNALKHAGPARARVRVAYEADSVLVEVSDDGTGAGNGNGTGHGLVGIRERVAIVGGELEAGPQAGGGYAVSARLPYAAER
jgi:signal transduction histidine kinase